MLLTLVAHPPTAATRRAAFPLPDEPAEAVPSVPAGDRLFRGPEARCAVPGAVVDEALRDLDAGAWAGRELASLPPADLAGWLSGAAPPGGETVPALVARTGAWLAALPDPSARAAEHVVAVTHPAVLRAAVLHVLASPSFWTVEAPPGTRLTLTHDTRRWTLRSLTPP